MTDNNDLKSILSYIQAVENKMQKIDVDHQYQNRLNINQRLRQVENQQSEQKAINKIIYGSLGVALTSLIGVVVEFIVK